MIYGPRVRLARELRGFTQTELAARVGVKQPAIAQIERGVVQPAPTTLDAISFATRFPPAYFRKPPTEELPLGSLALLYRARASVKARDLSLAHGWATILWDAAKEMLDRLEPVDVRLPRLPDVDPGAAARVTRSELGLPADEPIDRLIYPIERAGVLVFALPVAVEGFDAFSMWTGEEPRRPIIVASRQSAGDRLRFSVAHELGHLVMHAPANGAVAQMERAADAFAAAFLMPEDGIRRDLIAPVTLTSLAALKPRWKVSISALAMRARDLGVVSATQHRYLMKQMGARGWRTSEPAGVAVPPERPRAFRKMAEVLFPAGTEESGLAGAARLAPQTVREILEAHADLAELSVPMKPAPCARNVVPFAGGGGGKA